VLSVSLPLNPTRRYPPAKVRPFLEGFLPEGQARSTIERTFGVRRGDAFGLLAQIGRDCAGAVTFQPEGEPEPEPPRPPVYERLTDDEVVAEIEALGSYPLGARGTVRVSLAGRQDKLLLTGTPDGGWARPVGTTPSTHILKPQDERYPALVANEAFCLRCARSLGLTTIDIDAMDANGRPVLVVSRYDRLVGQDESITRIHQEDFCQALGIESTEAAKYEAYGGPSLQAVARVLDTWGGRVEAVDRLVRVMTFNVAVGNADAHGKNLSALHNFEGGVELAPLYDVLSTIEYTHVQTRDGLTPVSTDLAMTVGGVTDINEVGVQDLVREAGSWSYSEKRARGIVDETLAGLPDAIRVASVATPGVPDRVVDRVATRTAALQAGRRAGN
jgi:serine/threonine-protein kinase HipA